LFFGNRTEISSLPNKVHSKFSDEGLEINRQCYYPVVGYSDVRAVLSDEDLNNKSGEWLRDVDFSLLRHVLQSDDNPKPSIGGWGITAKPRNFTRWERVANEIPLSSTIQCEVVNTSPKKRPPGYQQNSGSSHRPFSYDPAQDYSTEPDR
jgi:hypothetical protein